MRNVQAATSVVEEVLFTSPSGYAVMRLDGTLIACNSAFAAALDHRVDALRGSRIDWALREPTTGRSRANVGLSAQAPTILHLVGGPQQSPSPLTVTPIPDAGPDAPAFFLELGRLTSQDDDAPGTEAADIAPQIKSFVDAGPMNSARLERLTENVPGGIYEFVMDRDDNISVPFATSGMATLLGVSSAAFRQDAAAACFQNIHPDDLNYVADALEESKAKLSLFKINYRIIHPIHGQRWLRANSTPVASPDGRVTWYGSLFDVTDEVKREQELEAAVAMAKKTYARLERLTDSVPGGIFEFMIDAQGQMRFPYVNSGMGPLMGTTKADLLEDAETGFMYDHPEDAPLVLAAIERSARTLEPVNITHRLLHPELGQRWQRINANPIRTPEGAVVWHGCIFDVTEDMQRTQELEAARNRMELLSLLDPLTDLPNRRACDEELARRVEDRVFADARQSVIRIDLDHFKAVNDTLGHAAGDAVLCRVGACMREVAGDGDFLARLGGDEFVIILAPGRTLVHAKDIVKDLRRLIKEPFMHEGRHCRFDASFGLATAEKMPADPVELLSHADAALLRAKEMGRGRTTVFTSKLHQQIIQGRRRATQIEIALERSEFVPFFQPQIDTATGEIAGFEVLARWQHPLEGFIPPDEFIPVAGQMRVVQDIDRMMFDKALAVLDRLNAQGHQVPKMSFNVSAGRVHDPDIIRSVQKLQTHGTRVAFELLESILLEEETAQFAYHIDLLKECGVEIEVDDFGSGRASVIGVLKVAPDTLKIDRRLIAPLFESQQARSLLKAIIDIGRSLHIDITAEGVETMDHAWALREMGCKTLQGYAFARPMTEADLRGYLVAFEPAFQDVMSFSDRTG